MEVKIVLNSLSLTDLEAFRRMTSDRVTYWKNMSEINHERSAIDSFMHAQSVLTLIDNEIDKRIDNVY